MTSNAVAPQRNAFFEAVGKVTVAGAHLDFSLHNVLGQIAFEPTLLSLANAEGTAKLIEWCERALANYDVDMDAEDVAELKRCLAKAKELKDKRNTIVHSLFMQSMEGEGMEALKPLRRTLGHKATKITIAEMEATASEMEALRGELFRAAWNATSKRTGMARIPQHSGTAEMPVSEA